MNAVESEINTFEEERVALRFPERFGIRPAAPDPGGRAPSSRLRARTARRTPGRAREAARRRGRLLLSDETALELNEVLEREKFDGYVRRETRREFVVALVGEATFVEPTEQIERCRDPDDDKFLELTAAGKASAIVSGDDDLLVLDPFRDIPILKAKAFLQSVERGDI